MMVLMKRIPFNERFFSEDNELSFYWAGLLAADGCLSDRWMLCTKGKPYKTHIKATSLTLKDRDLVERFRDDVGASSKKIQERKYKIKNGIGRVYVLELKSHDMFADLERFCLIPNKSLTLEFPEWVADHPLANHFIRGYFDGDGSIFWQGKTRYIEFRGTVSFLDSMNDVIKNSIGLKTKAITQVHSNCGSLKYAGNNLVAEVFCFLYDKATVWMDRKRKRFDLD